MENSYLVPTRKKQNVYEQTIKKSIFIGYCSYCDSKESAMEFINRIKKLYPDARHHCYGYIAGNPYSQLLMGKSDDGEPQGTAGTPILNVLIHNEIYEIVAVVVRYFGGIKLGAGGLIRAYSSTVSNTIKTMEIENLQPLARLNIIFPYSFETIIRNLFSKYKIKLIHVHYMEQVEMELEFPEFQIDMVKKEIVNLTSGNIRIKE
jgi:uncharacterized YigZ family protein